MEAGRYIILVPVIIVQYSKSLWSVATFASFPFKSAAQLFRYCNFVTWNNLTKLAKKETFKFYVPKVVQPVTNWQILLGRVLLEKLIVTQLDEKLRTFYGTRIFISTFTRARHWSPPAPSYLVTNCLISLWWTVGSPSPHPKQDELN
jgi:hypothetical protein